MKKISFLILLTATVVSVLNAGEARRIVTIEERFELNSIVWRLAGAHEYSMCQIPQYVADIDTFFAPYRNHPIVGYCLAIRDSTRVAYDAIATASAMMHIVDGRVCAVSDTAGVYLARRQSRWTPQMFDRYVELMDDFYRTSRFADFYSEHRPLYDAAIAEFERIVMMPGLDWFEHFYGREIDSYVVFLSLTNGPSNYGDIEVPGYDNGALVGSAFATDSTVVSFKPSVVMTLLHELMHKMANPLAYKHEPLFAAALDTIYPYVAMQLSAGAYAREAMLPEWFTRIGTICYALDNNMDSNYVARSIAGDEFRGFIWQSEAIGLMKDKFYTNRTKYPYFEDFIPELSTLLTDFVADINNLAMPPCIVGVGRNVKEDTVDLSKIDTLSVFFVFSEDMSVRRGVELFDDDDGANPNFDLYFKEVPDGFVWNDKRKFTVNIPVKYLRGIKQIGIRLHLPDFRSEKGRPGMGYPAIILPIVE